MRTASVTSVRVERPGLLTTVQDGGRFGYAHLGISASGAADALALRIGNLLVGNDENDAALEMTLLGGAFVFDADATIAMAGADFGATLAARSLAPWSTVRVGAGARLELGASRSGARCYLCVRGGFQVPKVLGSASTHLMTGLGGHNGRALAPGDVLSIGPASNRPPARDDSVDTDWIRSLYAARPIRVTPGPQIDWFAAEMRTQFVSSYYTVLEQSNRMGVRLTGPAIERPSQEELLTEGVSLGAIQVPQNGQPIVLFVEHQTTGGYPKIANVCNADMHRIGQLRPRDTVRFELVSFEEAHRELLELESRIERLRSDVTR